MLVLGGISEPQSLRASERFLTKRPQWTFIIPALSGFESREAEEAALILTGHNVMLMYCISNSYLLNVSSWSGRFSFF